MPKIAGDDSNSVQTAFSRIPHKGIGHRSTLGPYSMANGLPRLLKPFRPEAWAVILVHDLSFLPKEMNQEPEQVIPPTAPLKNKTVYEIFCLPCVDEHLHDILTPGWICLPTPSSQLAIWQFMMN